MTDKIRSSTIIKDESYIGDYEDAFATTDYVQCMDQCLARGDCVGWKYSGGICNLATNGLTSTKEGFPDGYSGKIELKNYISMTNVLLFIIFATFLALAIYRLLRLIN